MGKTFHSLHSLRGIAALAVLLFHAEVVLGVAIVPSGYLAVDLFFMLSGFVIAHAYDSRFEAGLSARHFIFSRAARFWTLFAVGTVIGAAWLILENLVSPPAAMSIAETLLVAALALSYVPQFTTGDLFPLNVPAWSLLFELIVNVAFAVFFSASRTKLLPFLVFVSACTLIFMSAAGLFEVQALGAIRAIYGFGIGVLLYRTDWRGPIAPSWLVIGIVCASFALPSSAIVEVICVLFVYPFAIRMLTTNSAKRQARLSKLLGDISFPLYALHYPVLQATLGMADHLPVPEWLTGLGGIAACLAVAWVGETVLDKPAQKFLARIKLGGAWRTGWDSNPR